MEITDGLNALLDTVAERAQEPAGLLALLVLGAFILAVVILGLETLFRQWRFWRRERATYREVARLGQVTAQQQQDMNQLLDTLGRGQRERASELTAMTGALERAVERDAQLSAEQQARSDKLLEALQAWQRDLAGSLPASSEIEADGLRQLAQEISQLTQILQGLNQRPGPAPGTPAEEDWLADLPQDPEARITALEQRREELRAALRNTNREISNAQKALPEATEGRQQPSAQDNEDVIAVPDLLADAEAVESREGAREDGDDATPTVAPEVFARILPQDYERNYMRLIIDKDGKLDPDSVRRVLGIRLEQAVGDKINGRALDILGDVLFYEEDGRLVVTEEFVDDLKRFLNDTASGLEPN